MKCYDFRVVRTITKSSGKVTIERKAEVNLDDDTIFGNIMRFEAAAKKVLSEIKKATKNDDYIEVEFTASTYDRGEGCNLIQKKFDRWFFTGNAGEKLDDTGVYLSPDTRYTEDWRDIFIEYSKGLFEGIANV